MNLSASMVKELREKSGAGMMDCKKALVESNGNMEDAIDWLRKQGLSAVAKKSNRVAAEGLIGISISEVKGAIVEINSETDFVARNELFQNFVKNCSNLVLSNKSDINVLKKLPFPDSDRTVDQELNNNIATIGENMNIRRVEYLEVSEGVVASYIHNKIAEDLGKLGVIVAIESQAKKSQLLDVGKQIAMHIAATSPKALNIDDLDNDLVKREKKVLIDQAMSTGKPKEIAEKMVQGRLQKFFQEVVLNEQVSVIDGETKIKDVIKKLSDDLGTEVKIKDFKILKLGEGIEVAENDFAAEVAATAGIK
ncbi:MAG: translation elongation factor Ts [Alphaproteobacteria bacterium TMED199]|nr:MAG: translation elongation factor Ts [Alphaproteobacteria bacterium TMED199]